MNKIIYSASLLIFIASACNKENKGGDMSSVPATYSFNNVNYSNQTNRILMLEELLDYALTGRNAGTTLSAVQMANMFSNTGSPFSDTVLNSCGVQLYDQFYSVDVSTMYTCFDSLAGASLSSVAGSNGIPGIVTSTTDPSKKYLLSANGFDYTEIIEKGVMGAVFYYQSIGNLLENISSDDNLIVNPGLGTNMEHHFDEVFGYFGVPINFPVNNADVFFWGEYCNDLDPIINSNHLMMNSFLKCRYAISKKEYSIRDAEITKIRENWDMIIAAAAIHEINESLTYFSDDALRNHTLSEFVGFVSLLKYNPYAKITSTEINTILGYIGIDLYNVTIINLNSAKNTLSAIYSLDAIKNIL